MTDTPTDSIIQVKLAMVQEFAQSEGLTIAGSTQTPVFTGIKSLSEAGPADVSFCRFEGKDGCRLITESSAGVVFVPDSMKDQDLGNRRCFIFCKYPRFEILKFIQRFWQEPEWEVDPLTNPCIHPTAVIGSNVRIGPFSVIGPKVVVGDSTCIGSGCHIEHATIGSDVNICNNVTIGGPGFGYETNEETGEVLNFPHIGGVKILDHVDVGSSTCIDRGSIGNTIVGRHTKIDNLVHIAHNVVLGDRCKVIALAIIGGSCQIGDGAWIAPASAVRDWRNVGDNAVVGIGAVVTQNVEAGATVVGNPAKSIQQSTQRYK